MTRIFDLRGRDADTIDEAQALAARIAGAPGCNAWTRIDAVTGEAVALVVELPDAH